MACIVGLQRGLRCVSRAANIRSIALRHGKVLYIALSIEWPWLTVHLFTVHVM